MRGKKLIFTEDKSHNSIVNIALLMPYYLIRNDTMFNQDTLNISNRYYNQINRTLTIHC